ncbi:MAG: hypothetical protein IKP40_11935 [Clostridia bacterium]|nr:hypothetical protein [Clostridia bacterium]
MKRKIMLLIALVLAAGLLGILAIASANHGVKSITEAIDAIGEVSYSDESRALIDRVDAAIAETDPNLRLTERVENLDLLRAAKVRYVERAITRLYRAFRDHEPDETILAYLADAREAYSHYFTAEDTGFIHNYQDLADIEAVYADALTPASPAAYPEIPVEREQIDLC